MSACAVISLWFSVDGWQKINFSSWGVNHSYQKWQDFIIAHQSENCQTDFIFAL